MRRITYRLDTGEEVNIDDARWEAAYRGQGYDFQTLKDGVYIGIIVDSENGSKRQLGLHTKGLWEMYKEANAAAAMGDEEDYIQFLFFIYDKMKTQYFRDAAEGEDTEYIERVWRPKED